MRHITEEDLNHEYCSIKLHHCHLHSVLLSPTSESHPSLRSSPVSHPCKSHSINEKTPLDSDSAYTGHSRLRLFCQYCDTVLQTMFVVTFSLKPHLLSTPSNRGNACLVPFDAREFVRGYRRPSHPIPLILHFYGNEQLLPFWSTGFVQGHDWFAAGQLMKPEFAVHTAGVLAKNQHRLQSFTILTGQTPPF